MQVIHQYTQVYTIIIMQVQLKQPSIELYRTTSIIELHLSHVAIQVNSTS